MDPKTLRIGSQVFTVKMVTKTGLDDDCIGHAEINLNILSVYKKSPPTRKIEVILHEVLHAILASYEFPDEEVIVVILGEALTLFIRDNPAFIRHALKVLSD